MVRRDICIMNNTVGRWRVVSIILNSNVLLCCSSCFPIQISDFSAARFTYLFLPSFAPEFLTIIPLNRCMFCQKGGRAWRNVRTSVPAILSVTFVINEPCSNPGRGPLIFCFPFSLLCRVTKKVGGMPLPS